AQGVAATARKHKVSEQTLYIWRRKYGGMEATQVADLKRSSQENARLKKLLAERDLAIEVMQEIAAKKW
ncbi:MAG: transposase, partial [Bryocella sp.]